MTESAAIGLLAGLLGTGLRIGAAQWLIQGGVGLTITRTIIVAAVCVALAIGGALVARLGATASVWRSSVAAAVIGSAIAAAIAARSQARMNGAILREQ